MNIADVLVKLAGGGLGGCVVVAIVAAIKALSTWQSVRTDAAKGESEAVRNKSEAKKIAIEADILDRDLWLREAHTQYEGLKIEYAECRRELSETKQAHDQAIGRVSREVGELKDALIRRVDVINELLPYVEGLPDDKMREIRAENRAVKMAIWGRT
jgi:hypothetical protein